MNRRKTKMQLSQVVESYLLEGIHARVFSRLANQYQKEDETLTRILDGMSMWTQRYVKSVFMIHVGGTRCVTSSTDNNMKIRARITLTVEVIRTCIFLFLLYV